MNTNSFDSSNLSMVQRIGQLNQRLYGWQTIERSQNGWRLTRTFWDEVERWQGLGAIYGLFRSDAWSGRNWDNGVHPGERAEVAAMIDSAVREVSPFDIGALIVEEVPHGHQALGSVLLPTNLAVGAGWAVDEAGEAAAAVSQQLRAEGVHLALVSALDLARDPRWGRSEECFGEAPLPAARFCSAVVEGMQGRGAERLATDGVGIVLKHFAGQGAGAGGRNAHAGSMGQRELAETHLAAAEAGVSAGAVGLMAAYNDIDGIPCCANRELLTELLRDRWGFQGIVMSDGLAIDRLAQMTGSLPSAAALALEAGVDLSLWDTSYSMLEDVLEAEPRLTEHINRSCQRVVDLKSRLGLISPARPPAPADHRPRIEVASRALARSAITLVHDPAWTLPLEPIPGDRWLLVGPRATDSTCLLGDYVPPQPPGGTIHLAQALAARLAQDEVQLVVRQGTEADVAELAASSAATVVALGGTSHRAYDDQFDPNGALTGSGAADCGEGVDLASLCLPPSQVELLRTVREAASGPVVTLVSAGRAYRLVEVEQLSDAVVVLWYPGPFGATAATGVLVGDEQPLGRTPVTLPTGPGVLPVAGDERSSPDDAYRDQPRAVQHPLGTGRGFARLQLGDLTSTVDGDGLLLELPLSVTAHPRTGHTLDSVVFVLAHKVGGRVWPRYRELVHFERVVAPAGHTTLRLRLRSRDIFVRPPDRAPLADVATTITLRVDEQERSVTVAPVVAGAPR